MDITAQEWKINNGKIEVIPFVVKPSIISRHLVFILMQKSSCAWNTDTTVSRKLNWIIKKIILYICAAGLSSITPNERENCSLISMILSNFPRSVNYCYCCYQQRQQRRLAIMTSKRSKWNDSLGELSIIIYWEISVSHCWKCNKSWLTCEDKSYKLQSLPLLTLPVLQWENVANTISRKPHELGFCNVAYSLGFVCRRPD